MGFDLLLPCSHGHTFTWLGLGFVAGPIAVRAALGHAPLKRRGRVVNVPPVILAAGVAAVIGHGL